MPPWAHSSILTLSTYMFWLSDRSPRERGTVTTQYVLITYCLSLRPFHTWLRLLSPHILHSTHSSLCLFTSYHPFTLCWCFTLVVNPLLTTIADHIFSLLSHTSVLLTSSTTDHLLTIPYEVLSSSSASVGCKPFTARIVLLYVLLCLTYMYCTLTVHTVYWTLLAWTSRNYTEGVYQHDSWSFLTWLLINDGWLIIYDRCDWLFNNYTLRVNTKHHLGCVLRGGLDVNEYEEVRCKNNISL